MMEQDPQDLPNDLLSVAEALQEARARLDAAELARVKRRALARGAGTALSGRTQPGGFMKSRLALIAVLALGALMSMGGAALGVSALSSGTTAGTAQYGPCVDNPQTPANECAPPAPPAAQQEQCPNGNDGSAGCEGVLGDNSGSGPSNPSSVQGDQSTEPSGDDAAGASSPAANAAPDAQAPRQVQSTGDDELPFTGYAAIPMLLVGIALLGGGMALRRSTRGDGSGT